MPPCQFNHAFGKPEHSRACAPRSTKKLNIVLPTTAGSTPGARTFQSAATPDRRSMRSEEHTSELQSRLHLVCRLLLEKKKKKKRNYSNNHHELLRNCASAIMPTTKPKLRARAHVTAPRTARAAG